MNRRIAVRGIAMKDGKLLCARLKPYDGLVLNPSQVEPWWCLPGGGLDIGESLIEGVEREFIEETGIKPKIGNLLYIQQFSTPHTNTEHLELLFHITNAVDYVNIDLSKASHGAAEIEEIDFVDPKTTNILPEFLQIEDIGSRIVANSAPKLFSFLT